MKAEKHDQVDITISIVSFNTADLLARCIGSVMSQSIRPSVEIIVVDNASQDDSVQRVEHEYPAVQIIRLEQNMGFAAANNCALEQAHGRYFMLLNSDTELHDGALQIMFDFMEKNAVCGICCPQLKNVDGSDQVSFSPFRTPKERALWEVTPRLRRLRYRSVMENVETRSSPNHGSVAKIVERPRGACFMVRMTAARQVGGMDDKFFMYDEEVDWALRIRNAGWENWFVPAAEVMHWWGASTKPHSAKLDLIHTQSDYRYFRKHYGLYGFTMVWLAHVVGAILELVICLSCLCADQYDSNLVRMAWKKVVKIQGARLEV